MKIGFVLDDGLDNPDGVQQYVKGLGKWMSNVGHEVHYLVGETSSADVDNIHVLAKNLSVRFNANRLSTPLPAPGRKIESLLREEMFDILHIQVPYSPFMAGKVIKHSASSTHVVGTFHVLPFGMLQRLGIRAWGRLLRRSSKGIDYMIAVSEPAAELCKTTMGITPTVIGNHVDIAKYRTSTKRTSDVVNLVFLGRLVERKGILELLEAIKIIQDSKLVRKPIKVHIGGDGPLSKKVSEYISDNNLSSVVTMYGKVSEKDKPSFLAQANIAIFPSLGGESFGIVLIEAMAANAEVVIGGDNPGYRSVLGNHEHLLVNPREHKGFARDLAELCNKPELRRKLNLKQQQLIQSYDINIIGERILDVYQRLAKSPSARQTKK